MITKLAKMVLTRFLSAFVSEQVEQRKAAEVDGTGRNGQNEPKASQERDEIGTKAAKMGTRPKEILGGVDPSRKGVKPSFSQRFLSACNVFRLN